ncbi:hypothetical protein [Desulforamulus putei]|uniref:Carbon-monoxide dehydrogenase iron sulfur subunit n=1 Tax=Desulforamulus putei DSM 12395 TaxID=1121429 RepID=A0A1M4W408_9FIRM|nr:hypothetical protein [Desulforamulus putei]SHE75682.1 carbon-monoxide dehydrogenase iron sulfur subunit [Desulforamulus putei DSM 12395]
MKRILINRELCNGCKNCQLACIAEHTDTKSILTLNMEAPANQAREFY